MIQRQWQHPWLRIERFVQVGGFLVAAITMAAVIYYATIAAHQRDAMRDQVVEMRKTNSLTAAAQRQTMDVIAAENRAWLDIQRIEGMSWSDDRRFRARAVRRNAGRAPATSAVAVVGLRVLKDIPQNQTSVEGGFPPYQLGTVLPGMDPSVPIESKMSITREQEDAIWKRKTLYLIVSGLITYTDRFKSAGSTPVCQYYDNAHGGFVTCGLNIPPQ